MLTNGATSAALPPSLERAEEAADNTCCCNEIESGAAQREGERRTGGGRQAGAGARGRSSRFTRRARLRLGKLERESIASSKPCRTQLFCYSLPMDKI